MYGAFGNFQTVNGVGSIEQKTDGPYKFFKNLLKPWDLQVLFYLKEKRVFAGSWCAHVCLEQCWVDLVPANAQSALCTILVRKWIDSFKQSVLSKPVKLFICESSWGGRGGKLFLTLSLTVIFSLFASFYAVNSVTTEICISFNSTPGEELGGFRHLVPWNPQMSNRFY